MSRIELMWNKEEGRNKDFLRKEDELRGESIDESIKIDDKTRPTEKQVSSGGDE